MKKHPHYGPQISDSKSAGKGRVLIPVLGLGSFLAALQAATQTFAHLLHYQPSLGANLSHWYAPWSIIEWAVRWQGQFPDSFQKAGSVALFVGALSLLLVAVIKYTYVNSSGPTKNLHGSARWANVKDIQAAGLLPRPVNWWNRLFGQPPPLSAGVYVGAWQDDKGRLHYLRHSGPEHVLTYAPTRSGKGVGLVVPTLLSWSDSVVITDLKGELWALTSGWRQAHAGNTVLRFEPAIPDGAIRWNPLDELRIGTSYEVGDVQNLAMLVVDPDGKGLQSHWDKTAFALLVGLIMHVAYKARNDGTPATLPYIDSILADPDRDIAELWMEMITFEHIDGGPHPVVSATGRDMLDREEREAGSVLSTTKSFLSLYRDPIVAKNISHSDFRIKDLMHHSDPVSLYIVTQPSDKARLRPLVRIMISSIVRLLADKMDFEQGRPVAHYEHKLLLMLDEFPALGKLEILQESLAFVAGYGIKCYLICQDLNQLKSQETGYGRDESITSNCHVQNAFPPNRMETAEHLSRLTGETTVLAERMTTSGRRMSAMLSGVSRSTQEVKRALLTPDECLRMAGPTKSPAGEIEAPGDMIVYVAGTPAIYGKQPLYFLDPIFQARAAIPAPVHSEPLRTSVDLSDSEQIRL